MHMFHMGTSQHDVLMAVIALSPTAISAVELSTLHNAHVDIRPKKILPSPETSLGCLYKHYSIFQVKHAL